MARTRAQLAFACVVVLGALGVWWIATDDAGSATGPRFSGAHEILASGESRVVPQRAADANHRDVAARRAAPEPLAAHAVHTGLGLRDAALVDQRAVSATVTLRDASGAALSDGFLSAVADDGSELASARADESGRVQLAFTLEDAFPGEFRDLAFELGAPGHARLRVEYRSGAKDFALGEIELVEEHVLSGRLVAPDGTPQSGVRVGVKPQDAPLPRPEGARSAGLTEDVVRTDAEGRFELTGLVALVNARVLAPGRSGNLTEITPQVRVEELASEGATRHELGDVVWPYAPLLGELLRVRLVDELGAPLAEARAALHLLPSNEVSEDEPARWLISASAGELPDAEGWVVVRKRPPWSRGALLGVVVAAPGREVRLLTLPEARDAEVELPLVTPLRLVFTDAETQEPLGGFDARVLHYERYSFRPNPWITLRPDVEPGGWNVFDPARRALRLELSQPGFGRRRIALDAKLPRGELQRFELPGPRRVSFRVVDSAGELRRDTRPALWGPAGPGRAARFYVTALQQEDGSFVALGAVPGETRLWLSTPGKTAPEISLDVVVSDASATDLGDIVFTSYGEVLLTVRDADGTLLETKPQCEFLSKEHNTGVRKDERLDDGRLRYYRLRPGLWRFVLEPGGVVKVEVEPGGRHEAELRLQRWARIEGRVLRDGEPVSGAMVLAFRSAPTAEELRDLSQLRHETDWTWRPADIPGQAITDELGRYVLELPARKEVTLLAADQRAHRSPLRLLDTLYGEMRRVDLSLASGRGIVEGIARRVVTGELAADVSILIDGVPMGRTDAEGRFRFEGLPEREVRVRAIPKGASTRVDGHAVLLSADQAVSVELEVLEAIPPGLLCY